MAIPMWALFSAGASFTPSPVTATTCFFCFSASTIRRFWSARTRAKTISGASSARRSWASVRARELLAGDHERSVGLDEPDLARDRPRRSRMIATHHDHADAGLAAFPDRLRDLRPRRILEPDEPAEDEMLLQSLVVARALERAMREREHAQARARPCPPARTRSAPGAPASADGLRRRDGCGRTTAGRTPARPCTRAPGRTASRAPSRAASGPRRTGPRPAGDARRASGSARCASSTSAISIGSPRRTVRPSCSTGRRSWHRRRAEEERLVVGDERASRLRGVDRDALHADEQLSRDHAVLRQRPGLVGADHRRRAERLDRGQVPDQHVPLRHALTRQHERRA